MARVQPRLKRIQQSVIAWFEVHSRDLPWRRTRNPYHVLVSEVMLQQTQVDRVLPKYRAFLERFPTLQDLAGAPPGDVIRAWAGLGYNRRALNLQRTAQAVLNEHGGQFPSTTEELRKLPGVGPYTAGAVACFAFEHDVAFMDTNIRRVIGRVFCGPESEEQPWQERRLHELAEAAVPRGYGYLWNQGVMELGALICTAARPRCTICPLRRECSAYAAWCKADEQIFHAAPRRQPASRKLAERPASYTGSNRYYRGRLVALLRDAQAGTAVPLRDLGPQIKEGWTDSDLQWIEQLARGLADDGLIVLEDEPAGAWTVRLP